MNDSLFAALDVLMAAVFVFAAVIQYNDPDPAAWVLVYGLGAVLCAVDLAGRLTAWAALVYVLLCVGFVLFVAASGPGEAHMGWGPAWGPLDSEVVREMLGLSLAAGWATLLGMRAARTGAISGDVE